jgi:hypothetical protein
MEGSVLLIPVLNPPKAGKRSKKVAKTKRRRSRRAKGTAATGKKKARRSRRTTKKAAPKRRRSKSKAAPKRRRRSRKAKSANPPKRRRRRGKRRSSRRSTKKNAPKRRRRGKRRAAKNTPKRRRRSKRRNPHVKRRGRRSKRRNVRYNGGRRGKRRGRRSNPGMGSAIGGIRTRLKSLLQVQSWGPPALQGALGIGAANYGPQVLSRFTSQLGLRNSGLGGVVLSGVSTALAASLAHMAASYLPKGGALGKATSGIARNVMVGGMIWTVVRLLGEVAPGLARSLYLPRVGGGGDVSGMGGLGMYGGHYPGQYPSNVYLPGLGMVTSPEDLVAGESAARQANEFRGVGDFMELSGMQDAVPFQDIRGMGGFADWVELQSGSAPAMEQFNPATETF